ncbi:MAG: AAA family ATPase [Sphingomonadaceae bacterium]|nr:AAA family ATPase [Gammaproteobacteria bacterium]MCP5390071.1 AAA family ATPase [Sphingomonadaceae bacterium]
MNTLMRKGRKIYNVLEAFLEKVERATSSPAMSLQELFASQMHSLLMIVAYADWNADDKEAEFINYVIPQFGQDDDVCPFIIEYMNIGIEQSALMKEIAYDTWVVQMVSAAAGGIQAAKFIDGIESIGRLLIAADDDIAEEEVRELTAICASLRRSVEDSTSEEDSAKEAVHAQGSAPGDMSKATESIDVLLHQLYELIGLPLVKQEVEELCNLMRVRKLREQSDLPVPPMSHHLVFTGNPGTGKTTIARLLAKIYREIGLLSKGHLIEVSRHALVGGFVGQTAIKTKEAIDRAVGGVLFIDEAYTLSIDGSESDYGQEAIDTLLKEMEDLRHDIVVIVAGYPEKMDRFINSNPGLSSRFSKKVHFADYSSDELYQIFCLIADRAGYVLSASAANAAADAINDLEKSKSTHFGNGREVRNLFEKVIQRQSNRMVQIPNPSRDDLQSILVEDIGI